MKISEPDRVMLFAKLRSCLRQPVEEDNPVDLTLEADNDLPYLDLEDKDYED